MEFDTYCSMCCHGVADRDLTSTVSVCSDACEARWAEQFCPECRHNIAEGEDHALDCSGVEDLYEAAE